VNVAAKRAVNMSVTVRRTTASTGAAVDPPAGRVLVAVG
jgi:hypothetical protein